MKIKHTVLKKQSAEFKKPIAVLKALEKEHGKAIPCTDFIIKMLHQGYKPLEVVKLIGLLHKNGLISEPRKGFIQKQVKMHNSSQ